jgi:HSP20 family protein
MTDPIAVPINIFETDRELMVVAPMPGVDPEEISIDVTDDGKITLRARQQGVGQERIAHLMQEWSYGPYERTVDLPRSVDASRANVSYGNGVLSVTLPKADATAPASLHLAKTGHARGVAVGHIGRTGAEREQASRDLA